MIIPEEIETLRLILKRPAVEFASRIFNAYANDPEVTKYMTWTPHVDAGQTEEFIRSMNSHWDAETEFTWSIFRKTGNQKTDNQKTGNQKTGNQKTGNQLIGMIGLTMESFKADAGYVLAREFWGNGYMPEALVAIRDLAFSNLAIERFQMVCDVDNAASARVMEKAGFEREGVLRKYFRHPNISEIPRDCLCYSYVR